MTTTDQPQQTPCPNCTKFGLPILPARYAVARHDDSVRTKAPQLEAPFGDGVQSIELPDAAAYTLRLLRSGYLYVFNESRDEWAAYQSDNYGDLTEFDIRDPSPPPQEDGPQAVCSRHGASALAKCIVIPDAKQTTVLWLAFSGTPWTPAVFARHRQASYRQRHMRQIDAGAWAATPTPQPHVDSLYRAADQVSDFKLAADYRPQTDDPRGIPTLATVSVQPGARPFDHSMSDCVALDQGQVDQLRSKAREAAHQMTPDHPQGVTPALIALDDPIGIAADINQLVLERIVEWEQEPERQEKKACASAVISLREAIRNGALEGEQHRRRDRAFVGRALVGVLAGPTARNQVMLPVDEWEDDWFKVEDEETVLRLGEESWEKYRKHLKDGDGYDVWLTQTYPTEQKAFYEAHLQALDDAFVWWLQAPQLHEHMICNFDPDDIDSGIQYQEAVAVMLQDAASRGVVYNHIARCLDEEDPEQPTAFVLRAQVWNQDKAVAAWKSAVASQGEGPSIDWGALSGGLFNALKELLDAQGAGKLTGAFENLAKYTEQLAGPLTAMVGRRVNGLATGAITQLPHKMQIGLLGALVKVEDPLVEIIDLVGHVSPQNASRALAATIAIQAGLPDRVSAGRPAREALRAGGAPTSGPGSVRFGYVVLANANQVRLMNALNIRAISPGDSYRAALPQHYRAHEFRGLLRQSIGNLGNRSLGLGVVGLIFAGGSLGQLSAEYKKAAAGERGLKAANFGASVVGVLGIGAEGVGAAGSKLPWFSQELATPNRFLLRNATTRAAVIAGVGRWLTGIGGVVMGGVTAVDGYNDRNLDATYGYTAMFAGVASIAAAIFIFAGIAAPVAIVLVIICAVVAVVVDWLKPDDTQRWLDKVMYFGNNISGVYPDLAAQSSAMTELQQVR
ncbi:T6SS effector BTH_I2691 family protein [Luteimonas terrae]|uniref:Toxin VasX N-terminal region domain-containing protein n=1 Tax=Luteimonas terrae TaxID=1530191 RepID=A0ABU1XX40_9GAMM|nr:T6SS effector BTH_I2691 family protein [Luteimonas terrae]MDR7192656.1 hypothetical protein [Luteimonas terrae]